MAYASYRLIHCDQDGILGIGWIARGQCLGSFIEGSYPVVSVARARMGIGAGGDMLVG